ncbi:hypothetical protein BOX15_Mlig014883g2 [Macrostomum lignano]|uniref:Uncharacterized protein n=1 Tax=Macrostomum lignano TaxID=282301 RepID=A0A267EU37_9PLAT|nr:hypothetical protein BOX15_Mlig014883g2 [Macrostomum lignano]
MKTSRLSNTATGVSRLSLSSTGGTDGGTTEGGGGDFGNQCADGSYADDSTDEGSTNIAKAEATGTGAEGESEPAMPEEVFKWMAHTVNQDFIRLGYPTILTKSADQEYVSLCPLIRNCSSVLTLLKARRCSSADVSATAASAAADSTTATSAGGVAAASTLSRRKRRRWGLFSSGKQNRRGTRQPQQGGAHQHHHQQLYHQNHQQQQHDQSQSLSESMTTVDSLHESMARKMRRDTERIIRRTRCLDARALQTAGLQEPAPYPEGSTARSDYAFVRSTWRSFRKLAQQRIAESAELAKRAEELQRQLTDANMEIEQLRTSINSSNNQQSQQQPASTSIASAQEAAGGGRLQRVGGFLRRAVSRERLTFGRSASRLDASTTPNHPQQLQQQQWPSRPQSDTRSRASSQPPPSSSIAVANHRGVEADSELHRIRAEFDRRERLLLAERERLRQANSKLTFRIQYLSGVASAAAKQQQQHQQQQQQSDPSFKTDRRLRRAERRVSELQRETSSLRKSLGEKTDALKSIKSAAAQLQRHSDETADTKPDQPAPPAPPPVDEPSRLAKFVESICQVACTRLQRLQRQCTDAEARVAALTECLRPAAAAPAATPSVASPAPSAATIASPNAVTPTATAMDSLVDQPTLEQTQLDLVNRIKSQLAALGFDRQEGVGDGSRVTGKAAGGGDMERSHRSVFSEAFRHLQEQQQQQQQQQKQQQQQQKRMRRASHDPRAQNSLHFY